MSILKYKTQWYNTQNTKEIEPLILGDIYLKGSRAYNSFERLTAWCILDWLI